MSILRGKHLIIATLSGFLVLGASLTANAKTKKTDNRPTVVNVALKPSNETDLTNYVYDTVDPNSANYHKYLSPSEFAQKFGQSDSYISSFKSYLNRYHLRTYTYPGNLSLKIRGTKANVNKAFKAKYVKEKGHESKTTYKLPGKLSKQVVAVIGVYAPNPKTKKAAKKTPAKKKAAKKAAYIPSILKSADVPVSDNKPNTNVTGNAFSKKYGALKFADRYQLNNLYDNGLEGQGQRIGIISDSIVHNQDLKIYWAQNGIHDNPNRIHRIYTIDNRKAMQKESKIGGTIPKTEAALDVESASSVAPKADIDIYSGYSNNNLTSLPSAYYTSFMQAISNDLDHQISTSYSPAIESLGGWDDHSATLANYNHALNLMFEQAATEGITVFQASGDSGPYAMGGLKEQHSFSTSPYQVIVGGTTLPYTQKIHHKTITVTKERALGDIDHPSEPFFGGFYEILKGIFHGSGGGFSALNPTPRYQQGIPGVNTFRAITLLNYRPQTHLYTINPHPKILTGTHTGRNLPDVSGNADKQTGYATYFSSDMSTGSDSKGKPILKKYWLIGGGTSYTSPQMAAANAIMNSGRTTSIGFWNSQIYKFAQQTDTPFNPLNDANNNNNLFYTGQPGTLYNQATGLGTINFDKLYQDFNNQDASQ